MIPKAFLCRLSGVLCLLALLVPLVARAELKEDDFKQWSLLAIQDEGRVKPLDTFAREALLRLTGGSFLGMAVYKDAHEKVWQPNDFLVSILISDPQTHDWNKEPLILVGYRPLIQKLGLDATRKRFSFEELAKLPALDAMGRDIRALRAREADPQLSREQQEVESISGRMVLFRALLGGENFLVVPRLPLLPQAKTGPNDARRTAWLTPGGDAKSVYGPERLAPVDAALGDTLRAYQAGDPYQFSLHARELRGELRTLSPTVYPDDTALAREYTYNHLGAFPWASLLYGIGAVCLLVASAGHWRALQWAGLGVGFAGLVMHAVGIGLRCLVAGRPPVTNMYESMIWVAFVVTALGYVFFAVYRGTTYLLAALPVGCLLLLLVQQLPVAVPGTIEPLRPVLRDNFWLTTHVLTETASYGAFALAMAFGHLLLGRYIINPAAARTESVLHFWLYRVMQLGILLITVGTILGAVWANYSWGRFWGWDPKETWAFITLLCYIVAVHGRIAGWWGQFGLAVASVVCFAAVVMAWYGVNFVLGKGLHSYGRGVGGEGYVATLLVLDAVFLAAACWRHQQASGVRRAAVTTAAEVPVPVS